MKESGQLPVAHRGPKRERGGGLLYFFEEKSLMHEGFGPKTGAFSCGDEEGEVDVCCDVLLADGVEDVSAGAMFGVGAECSAGAMGLEEVVLEKAVIDGEEPTFDEGMRGAHPPGARLRRFAAPAAPRSAR